MVEASKKRSRGEAEELEINVTADEPLSKRAARRLKKGRSLKQAPSSQAPLPKAFEEPEDERDEEEEAAEPHASSDHPVVPTVGSDSEYKKGTNGIWIGNLNFATTESDLLSFFSDTKVLGKSKPAHEWATIGKDDVVRMSFPQQQQQQQGRRQNKGFAYIDFKTPAMRDTAVALSERILLGRNVLIKPADNFDGRPQQQQQDIRTTPKQGETKILYVGNLPFDCTAQDLQAHLREDVKRVRMATFEDSGKCKGFAFVDFHAIEPVSRILANAALARFNGRALKMEFGQDRSLRRKPPTAAAAAEAAKVAHHAPKKSDPRDIKPGRALMDAPRASHAIVASRGEKVSFA